MLVAAITITFLYVTYHRSIVNVSLLACRSIQTVKVSDTCVVTMVLVSLIPVTLEYDVSVTNRNSLVDSTRIACVPRWLTRN